MDDKLVRLSDAISAILEDKISGQQLEIMRALGTGMQVETLNQACDRHAQYIRDLPAVDAVEVVRGEWHEYDDDYGKLCCSVCEEDAPDDIRWDYCPHCGARMDGEEEHNAVD